MRGVVTTFATDHRPLTDAAAAQMLAAIQEPGPRDAAWMAMSQQSAAAHAALWRDLTRRAPEEVRAPAAALLAFSAWLAGDGAEANLALDLIPASTDYKLARFTDALVQAAVPPSAWETVRAPSDECVGHGPAATDPTLPAAIPTPGAGRRRSRPRPRSPSHTGPLTARPQRKCDR